MPSSSTVNPLQGIEEEIDPQDLSSDISVVSMGSPAPSISSEPDLPDVGQNEVEIHPSHSQTGPSTSAPRTRHLPRDHGLNLSVEIQEVIARAISQGIAEGLQQRDRPFVRASLSRPRQDSTGEGSRGTPPWNPPWSVRYPPGSSMIMMSKSSQKTRIYPLTPMPSWGFSSPPPLNPCSMRLKPSPNWVPSPRQVREPLPRPLLSLVIA